ncbi:MAG: hypothetical protein QMD14_05980 [Candidatus Aenigmarchaeota archaeon]|nr:hypothetical protein [Candidatus Aenigmarchaeota archaeon]
MKGISLPFAMIVVTFFLVVMIFIPIFMTRIHIERIIRSDISFNTAQNALLSLLSFHMEDPLDGKAKPLYEIMVENITLLIGPNVEFLKSTLDMYIPSGCYKLFYEEGGKRVVLLESIKKDCKFNQTANTSLLLPYDLQPRNLVLVID